MNNCINNNITDVTDNQNYQDTLDDYNSVLDDIAQANRDLSQLITEISEIKYKLENTREEEFIQQTISYHLWHKQASFALRTRQAQVRELQAQQAELASERKHYVALLHSFYFMNRAKEVLTPEQWNELYQDSVEQFHGLAPLEQSDKGCLRPLEQSDKGCLRPLEQSDKGCTHGQ